MLSISPDSCIYSNECCQRLFMRHVTGNTHHIFIKKSGTQVVFEMQNIRLPQSKWFFSMWIQYSEKSTVSNTSVDRHWGCPSTAPHSLLIASNLTRNLIQIATNFNNHLSVSDYHSSVLSFIRGLRLSQFNLTIIVQPSLPLGQSFWQINDGNWILQNLSDM